jgi:hypothetical protein
MSAATQTKVFGLRLGIDPKLIAVALVALAGLLFWLNTRSDDDSHSSTASRTQTAPAVATPFRHAGAPRRATASSDRGVLRVKAIDPTRGDVDPTLRLGLLARLQSANLKPATRNLFETGVPVQQNAVASKPLHGPTIMPGPVQPPVTAPVTPAAPIQANIPLKYYGFARPTDRAAANRGFFLDGDNVLVAGEGDLLDKRYLVVQLTPSTARLEDTQAKLGQTLPVVPQAVDQQQ